MKTYITFTEAYLDVLRDVYENHEYSHEVKDIKGAGVGKKVNICPVWETTNYQFRIKYPRLEEDCPITYCKQRNAKMRNYIDTETPLFDSGNNNTDGKMGKLSKIWDKIKNPDGTINSNYGLMIYHIYDAYNAVHDPGAKPLNQWEWAVQRLKKYDKSCQAILHFNRPMHQWENNLDQPCTVFVQFIIRENKLHMTGYMRSNDLVYGTPYNISYFIKLMYRMCNELKDTYPDLTIGHYTHNATSLHIYKKHENMVKKMLKK